MDEADRGAQEAEATWAQARTVWWALVWRLAALAVVPGALFGFVQGLFFSFLMGPAVGAVVGKALGILTGALLTLPIVKGLLSRDFGTFAVRVVPMGDGSPP